MRVNHLLSAILKGPFAVEHQTVMGYLPRVAQLLNGEGLASDATPTTRPEPSVLVALLNPEGVGKANLAAAHPQVAVRRRNKSYDDAQPGSVAVVEIKGVMMKADQWGLCEDTAGTASLGRQLQEADQHENIAAIVLDIDSGGGAVDGMIEFNTIIAGLNKPVVVYSDGMIASAAYSAASGADLIVLNNVSCSVGSIGVMASLVDYQPVLEKMGVNFHTLRATGSERKNEDFYQLLAGNHKPYIANVLTPLRDMMVAAVRSGRGKKLKDVALIGDMFFADAAIANGLADEKGDFSYAVTRALELASAPPTGEAVEEEVETDPGNPEDADTLHDDDENDVDEDPNATTLPTNTMFGKNKFTALAALAGLEGAAVTEALVSAANDELEEKGITGAALIGASTFNGMEASISATTDALKAAGVDSVAALVAQRDAAVKTAAEFGSQPGELGTTATKLKGDVTEEGKDENQATIDGLAHNQGLDNNPLFN
ncbi:S49 family peptidase [Hymenobacter terricola]|uniref:S49 family peptidase n=1 Tax=Hymenobacter terricola TaxID=2819236 RepID=UPI001B310938|nr:S49 family peptidase [Hymenobacter terricola]